MLEGYESAYYVVENAEFVVSAGDCLPAGKKSMCFITSENPGGQQFSAKENEVRQLELMSDLRLSGVQFSEARSYDPSGKWMEEDQFCVMDADFQVMKELALKYNQRTIFWADINEPFGTVILDYTV